MIRLEKISKSYLHGFNRSFVLRDINIEVEEGEFLTIMGPSGSGKSTLLHILGMLDEPTTGAYYFFDKPVHKFRERKRTELHREYIGFVFQAYHLIDDLTVYENLETPLLYKKIKGGERKSMVAEQLDRFSIVAKKDLFPSQLSGGQQQQVGVARALIMQPKLILADEPTGNLHTSQGVVVMDWFKRLNEEDGVTIIQVTHSDRWATYGKRVIQLLDGRVESDTAKTKAEAVGV
ncbi:MAG: ABC transporter ATP-binding protein [Bacteroidetes bacterium]|nr:MAG: ABC transporter ATP-binding protein [Bacteroidota bacterium]